MTMMMMMMMMTMMMMMMMTRHQVLDPACLRHCVNIAAPLLLRLFP